MKKAIFILFSLLSFYFLISIFVFLFYPPSISFPVILDVKPGSSFSTTASQVKEKNLIQNQLYFKILARLKNQESRIQSGEYVFEKKTTPITLLKHLTSGKNKKVYKIVFPEGTNIYTMAEVLDKTGLISGDKFLELCNDPDFIYNLLKEKRVSLEGYLFPETYGLTKYMNAQQLIGDMVQNFLKTYNEVWPQATAEAEIFKKGKHLTRHEVVTLASILEKETGAPEERALISSVIHNRLRKNMRLEMDPTVLYGILTQTKRMKKNITKRDLRGKNKYNTYTLRGLPIGPISNPGKAALLAVLRPAKTNYYFFVSRNDGTHVFSETYQQHVQAVRKYQLSSKARRGKSWRDIHKRR